MRNVDGREVCWIELIGDETGSLGSAAASIAARAVGEAARCGVPVVIRLHTASSHPADAVASLAAWGRLARALCTASGVVPTVGIVDGAVASGLSLTIGLLDAVVMIQDSHLYVSGPAAVHAVTGRDVDVERLGGAAMHRNIAGTAHLIAADLDDAVVSVTELLDFLPQNNAEPPPAIAPADPVDRACDEAAAARPHDPRTGYDMRRVITDIVDDHDFLELRSGFGTAMVCGLGRLGGVAVGVVANQPNHLAGAIDIPASQKAARFVQWCDAFSLPIVTLVDTPGYLPGRDLEWDGMIRHGGQLAFAYAEATVPRLCVIVRKAFGGAYIVMDSKAMGNDLCLAWPDAEIAVMGAPGAVEILDARRLSTLPDVQACEERRRLEAAYVADHLNCDRAAARGDVDAVIEPATTRAVLCAALPSLLGKRTEPVARKHRNGPL